MALSLKINSADYYMMRNNSKWNVFDLDACVQASRAEPFLSLDLPTGEGMHVRKSSINNRYGALLHSQKVVVWCRTIASELWVYE